MRLRIIYNFDGVKQCTLHQKYAQSNNYKNLRKNWLVILPEIYILEVKWDAKSLTEPGVHVRNYIQGGNEK